MAAWKKAFFKEQKRFPGRSGSVRTAVEGNTASHLCQQHLFDMLPSIFLEMKSKFSHALPLGMLANRTVICIVNVTGLNNSYLRGGWVVPGWYAAGRQALREIPAGQERGEVITPLKKMTLLFLKKRERTFGCISCKAVA